MNTNKQEIWRLLIDYGMGKYYNRLPELNAKVLSFKIAMEEE